MGEECGRKQGPPTTSCLVVRCVFVALLVAREQIPISQQLGAIEFLRRA